MIARHSSATVVVGGSVASLVAADRLAAAGRQVDLHLPERGVGGGFLPIEAKGRRLDLGARLIELSYDDHPGAPPPLAEYVPGPHGHRPYLAHVEALVRGLAGDDLIELAPCEVSVDGARCADFVLNGDLSGLVDVLDADELSLMAHEARACVAAMGPHGVFAPAREDEQWARSFGALGRAHTGALFHERLIESVASKILPGGTDEVIGALHRKIWLPLFHPVTAFEACTGELTYRPKRAMYTLADGGMGAVVQRLVERVRSAAEVTVFDSGSLVEVAMGDLDQDVWLRFEDGSRRLATRPVLGTGADELFAAAGDEPRSDRVDATMVWVDVADEDIVDLPPLLFATEPGVSAFRVSENRADRRPGFRTVCCELDHRLPEAEGWGEAAAASLQDLGIVRSSASVEVVLSASRPTFVKPSVTNWTAFLAARNRFDRRDLPVHLIGGSTAFGADSFNEQLVQGLRVAAALAPAG